MVRGRAFIKGEEGKHLLTIHLQENEVEALGQRRGKELNLSHYFKCPK